MARSRHHRRLRTALAVIVALLATFLVAPGGASAGQGNRDLTVMTQNLYLGSSLVPALSAQGGAEFLGAIAQIYATVQYTDFPARAEAIADEIEAQAPDLIGLQEVTKWTTGGPNAPAGYDFLAILQGELADRELNYSVAAVSDNASIGPAPLVLPGCVLRSRRSPASSSWRIVT